MLRLRKLTMALALTASCWMAVGGQDLSPSGNYVVTRAYWGASGNDFMTDVSFFDGLGRPLQEVQASGAPDGRHLVTHHEYDLAGRDSVAWRPVTVDATAVLPVATGAVASAAVTTYGNGEHPYTTTLYDCSPLNRVTSVLGPGAEWHSADKKAVTEYRATTSGYTFRRFAVTAAGSLLRDGHWAAGDLTAVKTTDEDGHRTYVFTDMRGLKVMERRFIDETQFADTHFVYDWRGLLCYVLPPMVSNSIGGTGPWTHATSQALSDYAYCYRYDSRERLVERKMPGCAPEELRYDKSRRVAFSQNGNERSRQLWHFYLYDQHGRLVVEGLHQGTAPPDVSSAQVRAAFVSSGGAYGGYDIAEPAGLELDTDKILRVNYFDGNTPIAKFASGCEQSQLRYRDYMYYDRAYNDGYGPQRGQLTGTAVRVLGADGEVSDAAPSPAMLCAAMYYDAEGRLVQRHEGNVRGGYDHDYLQLALDGKVSASRHVHGEPGCADRCDVHSHAYDHRRRPSRETAYLDTTPYDTLFRNEYNLRGELERQWLGRGSFGEVYYGYNTRGWLRYVSNAYFVQTLHFADEFGNAVPCYNGNVSAMEWSQSDDMVTSSPVLQHYRYCYDGLDRLVSASYGTAYSGTQNGSLLYSGTRDFSTSYEYDMNGNMTRLRRQGVSGVLHLPLYTSWSFGSIDDVTFTHDGNQLRQATDQCPELTYAGAMDFRDGANEAVEYAWDANGNMTSDLNAGVLHVTYNALNHPSRVVTSNGAVVEHVYAADGRKLRSRHLVDPSMVLNPAGEPSQQAQLLSTTDYCGNYVLRNDTLERVMHATGYWTGGRESRYFVKDYLGSVRSVIDDSGHVLEHDGYYPYGAASNAAAASVQPLKFGGKEVERHGGLGWHDFEARWLANGRFTAQDPKRESYYPISPYTYCADNPIRYVDYNGKEPTPYEAALIAKHVYGEGGKLVGGWQLDGKIYYQDNGLQYGVYFRKLNNGKMDYVLAFAGTNDKQDITQDIQQALGGNNIPQSGNAQTIGRLFISTYNDGDQTVVGHSLGGNHALVVSLDTGIRAITFNPAALNLETKIKLIITNNDENITNYVVKGEIVSHYQSKIGLYLDGKTITIGNYWDKNISFFERYQRHKIDRVIYEMDKRH